jgi:hypothetical protein
LQNGPVEAALGLWAGFPDPLGVVALLLQAGLLVRMNLAYRNRGHSLEDAGA